MFQSGVFSLARSPGVNDNGNGLWVNELLGLVAISAKCRSLLAGSILLVGSFPFPSLSTVGLGLITKAGGIDFDRDVLRTSNDFGDCNIDSTEHAKRE